MHLSDEEPMEALMTGDAAALRPLVGRHHANLLGFPYRMVGGDRRLADDLVHSCLQDCRASISRLHGGSAPAREQVIAAAKQANSRAASTSSFARLRCGSMAP